MNKIDVDVCTLESLAEADALTDLLADYGIDAMVFSYHDSAFDGLWQTQHGWGRLRVAAEDAERAELLVSQWRQAEPETEERRQMRRQRRTRDLGREHGREHREEREFSNEKDLIWRNKTRRARPD